MGEKTLNNLEKLDIKKFQNDLISWFEAEKRDLPWRNDQDPYKVWVSEIMLQQTRVDTVIPYFNRFIENFPTIQALSEADEEKVLKMWEGLGYYSRVRNLHSAVKEVIEKYDGVVPNTPEKISSLKGVGPYTAGAILSIAYGLPEPAVDGNVMRVISRVLSIWDDIAKTSSRKTFEAAIRAMISQDNPSFFNQALMDLGAQICTPTSPSCLLCPVREHCISFDEGTSNELPVKTKNKKQKDIHLSAAILKDESGKYLIHKRGPNGLLANLWEFPNTEINLKQISEKEQLRLFLNDSYRAEVELSEIIGHIEHVFSHLKWYINVYEGKIINQVQEQGNLRLVNLTELNQLAFPVSHQKMIRMIEGVNS